MSAAPKRVLLVEINEDGTAGGSHQCLFDLARSLDRRRFVPVVLFYQGNRFVPRLRELGVAVHVWEREREEERAGSRRLGRAGSAASLVGAIRRRVAFLRRERIDLVHLNNTPALGHDDWLPAARLLRLPCIAHCRGEVRLEAPWLRRWLAGRFDRVIAISRHIEASLVAAGVPASRIAQVYDGIDVEGFLAGVQRPAAETRRRLGIPPERLVLALVGHLRPWKGQDVALAALAELDPAARARVLLLLVGGADPSSAAYRDGLEAAARRSGLEDCVRFLGERSDAPDLMNAADVVLHTSTRAEPFGLVVLEGMALGKPVIAARLGGPLEIASEGSALLFDPRSPKELAEAIAALLADPARRTALGEAARARVARFALARNVAALERIYAELGAPPRRAVAAPVRIATGPRAAARPEPAPILFTHFGEDWIRGSERCLLDLLRHLDRSRFRPLAWCNAPAMARALRELDVPVRVDRFPILFDWAPPRYDFAAFARLVRQGLDCARREELALLHANSGAPNQWLVPVARARGIPLLAHLHARYQLRERCTLGLHQVSLAVGVSEAVIAPLLADGVPRERTRVIHNGIDFERLAAGHARGLREELGIAPGAPVLTAVGSLIPRKGFDLLLEALARLGAEHRPAQLLIVGEGPERGALEAQRRRLGLEGRVHLLGERSDVGAIFRDASDVAVSAAREEAFGLTLVEAAACGLPVLATRVSGCPEALQEGVTGLLVPPEDPAALAAALGRLLADPAQRRRLGEAGRRFAQQHFRVERYVDDFHAAYEALLQRPRRVYGWLGEWSTPAPWARLIADLAERRLPALGSGG